MFAPTAFPGLTNTVHFTHRPSGGGSLIRSNKLQEPHVAQEPGTADADSTMDRTGLSRVVRAPLEGGGPERRAVPGGPDRSRAAPREQHDGRMVFRRDAFLCQVSRVHSDVRQR